MKCIIILLVCVSCVEMELICILGKDLACKVNCVVSTGHFAGYCNNENDCVCQHIQNVPGNACADEGKICNKHCIEYGAKNGRCNTENECLCG